MWDDWDFAHGSVSLSFGLLHSLKIKKLRDECPPPRYDKVTGALPSTRLRVDVDGARAEPCTAADADADEAGEAEVRGSIPVPSPARVSVSPSHSPSVLLFAGLCALPSE